MTARVHLGLAAALLAACAPAPAPARPAPARAAAGASPGNPFAALSEAAAERLRFAGRVEERLVAGPYAYLGVRDDAGALRWVATLGGGQPPGAAVEVRGVGLRNDFRSPRLGRVFAELVFGPVAPTSLQNPAPRQG